MQMELTAQRIKKHLEDLSKYTSTPGQGVTRFPFTKEARMASEYIMARMAEIGLKTYMDNSGSVIGRLEGQIPETVMIG